MPTVRATHLKEQYLLTVKEQVQVAAHRKAVAGQLLSDQQVSLLIPTPAAMATSGCGTGIVDHNAQAVVDTEHHMIVAATRSPTIGHGSDAIDRDRPGWAAMPSVQPNMMTCLR